MRAVSFALSAAKIALPQAISVDALIWPTLPADGAQTVISRRDPATGMGFALVLTPNGMTLEVGPAKVAVGKPLRAHTWYRVWASYDAPSRTLSAGQHSLVFRGREANAAFDQLLVTNDRSYVPDVIFTITTPSPLKSSIELDPAGAVTVSWPAVSGKTYRVMYKNKLTDKNWKTLRSDVKANSNKASQSDYVVGNRFYQVVELP